MGVHGRLLRLDGNFSTDCKIKRQVHQSTSPFPYHHEPCSRDKYGIGWPKQRQTKGTCLKLGKDQNYPIPTRNNQGMAKNKKDMERTKCRKKRIETTLRYCMVEIAWKILKWRKGTLWNGEFCQLLLVAFYYHREIQHTRGGLRALCWHNEREGFTT